MLQVKIEESSEFRVRSVPSQEASNHIPEILVGKKAKNLLPKSRKKPH